MIFTLDRSNIRPTWWCLL